MARKLVYDGKVLPDRDPSLTPDEVRLRMANIIPELSNAEVKERVEGEDTIYEFVRRVGTKGESQPVSLAECKEFLGRLCESAKPKPEESTVLPVLSTERDEEHEVLIVDFGTEDEEHHGKLHLYFEGDRFAYGFTSGRVEGQP